MGRCELGCHNTEIPKYSSLNNTEAYFSLQAQKWAVEGLQGRSTVLNPWLATLV